MGSVNLWSCRNAGSLSAPLRGSTAAAAWPRIGSASTERPWRSCVSPQSASCSENSAIRPEVSGQTLRASFARLDPTRGEGEESGSCSMVESLLTTRFTPTAAAVPPPRPPARGRGEESGSCSIVASREPRTSLPPPLRHPPPRPSPTRGEGEGSRAPRGATSANFAIDTGPTTKPRLTTLAKGPAEGLQTVLNRARLRKTSGKGRAHEGLDDRERQNLVSPRGPVRQIRRLAGRPGGVRARGQRRDGNLDQLSRHKDHADRRHEREGRRHRAADRAVGLGAGAADKLGDARQRRDHRAAPRRLRAALEPGAGGQPDLLAQRQRTRAAAPDAGDGFGFQRRRFLP